MTQILNIISSPRGEASNSIKLANAIIGKLSQNDPTVVVKHRDLTASPPLHLDSSHLEAFFTTAEQRTDAHNEAIRYSDELIKELLASDIIVIGAPMYNFNIPSTLKAWVDQVTRAGMTFKYTPEGPIGLVSDKRVYLAVTSGGIYSKGPGLSNDFLTSYLKFILAFMGMTDVTVVRGEGFAIPELQDIALENALGSITI